MYILPVPPVLTSMLKLFIFALYIDHQEVNTVCGFQKMKLFYMKFETFKAATTYIMIFLVMTPCSLEGGYQHFGGTSCFHLQGT